MTAYVVAGLAQAEAAGVQVETEAGSIKARRGSRKALAQDTKLAPDLRAYMAYALADRGPCGCGNARPQLWPAREAFAVRDSRMLGLALRRTGKIRVPARSRARSSRPLQQDGEQAWWPARAMTDARFLRRRHARSHGLCVEVPLAAARKAPVLPKAALWLMNHRESGLLVELDQADRDGDLRPDRLSKATNELHAEYRRRCPSMAALLRRSRRPRWCWTKASSNPAPIGSKLPPRAEGRLYYSVAPHITRNQARMEKQASISLNILRDYFRLVPTKADDRLRTSSRRSTVRYRKATCSRCGSP